MTSFEIGYHLYADDSQLLDKTTLQNLDACRLRIESCVESVREWCSSRRLQLNSDKTELIWFGTRSMLSKLQGLETGILVSGLEVKPVESVRDLGVTLDCQLNMRAHISKIVSACYNNPQDSTTSTLPRQGRSTKTSIGSSCCRGSTIATSHLLDYLRFHWLPSSESSTPLLASLPISDLATMSAMFYAIYIGSQSVSEYHTRCAS